MRLLIAILIYSGIANTALAEPSRGEIILISGGPALRYWEDRRPKNHQHDQWWGNFIRAARIRIAQLREERGPRASITWLVHGPSYSTRSFEDERSLISFIRTVEKKYSVNLVFFESSDELIAYLNRGRPRERFKIALLEYFGHSNKHAFMFDYSNAISGASITWLHEDDLVRIDRNAFASKASVKSWGCHTGESMSKKWRKATGVRMEGAVGKTDYSHSYLGQLPTLSSPHGRWKR